jgi:nitroimidazol reductase NimA-like FMN-containing flavoprotein (pyridoxamine 5'-phosphate oxidase superfamily)
MRRKGPWNENEAEQFLARTRVPVRIACNGASGHPVIASLWFVSLEDRIWCATQRSASIVKHLRRDDRCAFEVAQESSPYCGVRGQALARLDEDRAESILRLLIERYLDDPNSRLAQWLLDRSDEEVAIAIEPISLFSWDYSARMGAAT